MTPNSRSLRWRIFGRHVGSPLNVRLIHLQLYLLLADGFGWWAGEACIMDGPLSRLLVQ